MKKVPNQKELIEQLKSNPNIRILERIDPERQTFSDETANAYGLIIDTETSGFKVEDGHKAIEIGALLFTFNKETGAIVGKVTAYSHLEDPGFPLDPENSKIHGIKDEDLAGKKFAEDALKELLEKAQVVICHNSKFDRPFLEARFPEFAESSFGCSYADIDWSGEGYEGAKLKYLAYQQGKFYEAHRALTDCEALMDILSEKLPESGVYPLKKIWDRAQKPTIVIGAVKSPFSKNQQLREIGFRFNSDAKIWETEVDDQHSAQLAVANLQKHVYTTQDPISVMVQKMNPGQRFTTYGPDRQMYSLSYIDILPKESPSETNQEGTTGPDSVNEVSVKEIEEKTSVPMLKRLKSGAPSLPKMRP